MKSLTMLIASLFLIAASACKKFVEVGAPADRVIAARVFSSDARAISAVSAIYGNIINGGASFANSLATASAALSADELLKFNPSATEQELMSNEISTANANASTLWKSAYATIYSCNSILEGLAASFEISLPVRSQLTGECKFLRAFSYFYLVNFFGDVPLVTGTDYRVNANLQRSAVSTFIMEELKAAKDLLPEAYPTAEKTRPNKWTAAALLARAYLYNKDWQKAETEATVIIGTGLYTPLQPLTMVFLKNSKEAIWQLAPVTGLLRETSLFRPSGTPAAPQYHLTPALVAAFENGDGRRTKWLDSLTYLNTKYYYPGKYKNTGATVTEYYTTFRAAELYLIRAEARAQQGNLTGAIDDLNTIRGRAGLAPLASSLGATAVESAIGQERRVELFAEWGHRWFDLVRWGKATAVLSPLKPFWQPTDVLYPVPQDEIISNAALTQNPGY